MINKDVFKKVQFGSSSIIDEELFNIINVMAKTADIGCYVAEWYDNDELWLVRKIENLPAPSWQENLSIGFRIGEQNGTRFFEFRFGCGTHGCTILLDLNGNCIGCQVDELPSERFWATDDVGEREKIVKTWFN